MRHTDALVWLPPLQRGWLIADSLECHGLMVDVARLYANPDRFTSAL